MADRDRRGAKPDRDRGYGNSDFLVERRLSCAGERAPEVLATEQAGPVSLALDETHVYWVNQQGGSVMRCPKVGCGEGPQTVILGIDSPSGIVVDDRNVYWTNFGDRQTTEGAAIVRVAKPPR